MNNPQTQQKEGVAEKFHFDTRPHELKLFHYKTFPALKLIFEELQNKSMTLFTESIFHYKHLISQQSE